MSWEQVARHTLTIRASPYCQENLLASLEDLGVQDL